MKIIQSEKIQSAVVTDDFPEIMESIDASITDDSKDVLDEAVKGVSGCNKKLKQSVKELGEYMTSMVEAFEKMDKEVAKTIEQNVAGMSN